MDATSPDEAAPRLRPRPRASGLRVVGALLLREMSTTYGRSPGGYIWAILQPVAMIVILTLAFSLVLRAPSLGTSFVLFYATGFLPLRMFQDVSAATGAAIQFNRAMLAYPRVTFADSLIARSLLAVLTQVMVIAVVMAGIFAFEDIRVILDFRPVVLALSSAVLMAVGIGTLNSYLTLAFPVWKTIWGVLTRPLLFVSGVFYIYEDLPRVIQDILWWNPLIHVTGLMRTGFYTTYEASYVSAPFQVLCGMVPMAFGMLLLRRYCRDAIYK